MRLSEIWITWNIICWSTRWLMCAVIDGCHRILVAFCTIRLFHSLYTERRFLRLPVLSVFFLFWFCYFSLSVFLLPLLPADLHFSLVSNSVCYAKLIAHLIFSIHKYVFSFVFMKKITPRTHRKQSKLKREIKRKTNVWPGIKSNKQVVNRNRFVSCCSLLFDSFSFFLFVSRFTLYYVCICVFHVLFSSNFLVYYFVFFVSFFVLHMLYVRANLTEKWTHSIEIENQRVKEIWWTNKKMRKKIEDDDDKDNNTTLNFT